MKDSIVQQCLDILKQEDIKTELASFCSPVIDIIMVKLNPYIVTIVILVFLMFIMILAILFIFLFLLRNRHKALF
jgi:hypothetical protein